MILMKMNNIYKALAISSSVSLGLLFTRMVMFADLDYWYLAWNLFLGWVPMLFAILLVASLSKRLWLSWQCLLLTFLWLVFLPNSFYIATDFIHILEATPATLLYDIVLILSFTLNGFIMGYLSVIAVHDQLLKRIKTNYAHYLICFVFLLCSFAIYLGRYLRWNTWDIVLNPAGLLFDVSDRLINPLAYEQTFSTTVMFFVLISTFYYVTWQAYSELRKYRDQPVKVAAKSKRR